MKLGGNRPPGDNPLLFHMGGSLKVYSQDGQMSSMTGMSDSTPVKNRLIPAGAQMMSAWLVNVNV